MCVLGIGALAVALLAAPLADAEVPALVRAEGVEGRGPSPRRLFNMGLAAEEQGDSLGAVARYMAARLADRTSFADSLYARGAGLRLLRLLAGRDDDAAAAVAAALARDDGTKPGTDLSPLVRSLLARVERDFLVVEGVIGSVRLDARGGTRLEVLDAAGHRHTVTAPAPVGPFSAGDTARLIARTHGASDATLIAIGRPEADAWGLMAVHNLSSASPALGALTDR